MPRTSSSTAASSRTVPSVPDAPECQPSSAASVLAVSRAQMTRRADLARSRDHGRDRHRLATLDGRGDLAELGETGLIDPARRISCFGGGWNAILGRFAQAADTR